MNLRKPVAIIVGGGPVGLTAALGLTRANIDFILLEQRKEVVVEEGSDMTLIPMTMAALDQMNLLEPLSSIWHPVSQIGRIDQSGRKMGDLRIFQYLKEGTGYYPMVVSRRNLIETLYKALPKNTEDKILTNKKVSEIRDTHDGVTVSCTDGTAYNGSFVIGADGAYSVVREYMRRLALDAGSSDVNEAEPFLTTYQALWIRFPMSSLPGCKPGIATETHGSGIATQLFTGRDTAATGIYRKLPTPTKMPPRYSEKDEEDLVKEWGNLPLLENGTVRIKDAYDARVGSGLVCLEEGVLRHWSWNGRIVLVGDAAHKFTPSTGSGVNHGIIDIVFLMNELHDISRKQDNDAKPWWDQSSLSLAFQNFQQKRVEAVTAECQRSGGATAMATWTNLGLKLFDQYLMPNSVVQWWLGTKIASKARATKPLVFNFE